MLVIGGAIAGAVYFMYANYQRNKKKIVRVDQLVDHLYKHLGLEKPAPPQPTPVQTVLRLAAFMKP